MLNERQLLRMVEKIKRFQKHLEKQIFKPVGSLSNQRIFETDERLYQPPATGYRPLAQGDRWGHEGGFGWFAGEFTVPEELEGQELYLLPVLGGGETLLFVNGLEYGIFAHKWESSSAGHHYSARITDRAKAGETISIHMEAYANHSVKGTQPFEAGRRKEFTYTYQSMDIGVKDQLFYDCYFDLRTITSLFDSLEENSYRRAQLLQAFEEIHKVIYYDYDNVSEELYREGVRQTREILVPVLAQKNAASAPHVAFVGHSHMDTAWLWSLEDTIKKCARTYSNQLNLMDRYPEHLFIQSSAYHSYMLKTHYPSLFERIARRVREGRYEPNGGVWVECDCNMASGESMVRQFLWGQRFTREHFGYTSDVFWLPDTFGYSPSIPQIMKGCGVDYFLTTKMSWNDTNQFPYDTFWWQGLDGTRVLTHLNLTHAETDPQVVREQMYGSKKGGFSLKMKTVSNRRLIAYGYGDGGGGPQFESLEVARRIKDLDGCPKTEMMSVSRFMKELEETVHQPPVYAKELYLELHRGTLTNQHEIKRNNRKAEIAIHDAEFMLVAAGVLNQSPVDGQQLWPYINDVLVNQFHDVLPGTSIPIVHQQCKQQVGAAIEGLTQTMEQALPLQPAEDTLTVVNTLSFDRQDTLYLPLPDGKRVAGGYPQQQVTDLEGKELTAVAGLPLKAYAAKTIRLEEGTVGGSSPFTYDGTVLTTPFARITFAENGGIASFIDLRCDRELRGDGYPLNTFLMGEDVPLGWDNWDIDADLKLKLTDCTELLSRELVSEGPVELRIRSRYRLSDKSTLTQDMIVYADSPMVVFDTLMDWHDDHRFLKTAFDTTVFADFARFEIQFGHIKRPTVPSTSEDQAKFEVVNHKFTDLSENRYGAALLNDCKYGISVEGGQMRLSLHKGGNRPDYTGDHGLHRCCYAFLPHDGGFSAETVVQGGYQLNQPAIVLPGACPFDSMVTVDLPHVIIETVKPCEDGGRGYILRLYESEGTTARAHLRFGHPVIKAELTNMLEEPQQELSSNADGAYALTFRPFEIKTVRVTY